MHKVLITGGTGFLGRSLAFHLTSRGHRVAVMARPSDRAEAIWSKGIGFHAGDVRDAKAVQKAVRGHDVVVHLAAAYRAEGRPYRDFEEINVGGTKNVLEACVANDVGRVLHVSTTGVYGVLKKLPADEGQPYHHTDAYQKTKVFGEQLAWEMFNGPLAGRGVVIRPTGVYGPGDTRILKLVRGIDRGYFVRPGPCKNLYHPSYVDDVMDGFERAITSPNAPGNAYNLAGREYMPMRQYLATIARLLGRPEPRFQVPLLPLKVAAEVCGHVGRWTRIEPPLYPRRLGFFHFDRAFSIEKGKAEIGYAPEVTIEEGLKRTIAWWRSVGLLGSTGAAGTRTAKAAALGATAPFV
ncbi:MAG: NAD(P)-dependent oxidoreductase [Geminicoccaceae bacterium]